VENGEPDEILTIVELESAINYFNRLSPPRAGIITSPEVRKLANLYGAMVYERKDSATLSSLDEIQHAAILAHRHAMSENPNPNSLAE
jgi:hypothetical protein